MQLMLLMFFKQINKVSSTHNTYHLIADVAVNKHNTRYANGNTSVTKIDQPLNFNDNNYFTNNIGHTSNITNNITRHGHNTYAHNVMNKLINI